ncbi:lipoprotein insertase outer membrane protein LolB [Martelella alba]|uniref:Outer-membrane lipoprotein LolB n=1 Tax=Martelella alba TaxID=2590451 RepID=A0ABY2SJB5_9HYPH|nr:lipoprotein insertase outer membrane protein LolB [Martelella alba]TKI05588.1 lipoprotein localization protein LolB [Martelella alba]
MPKRITACYRLLPLAALLLAACSIHAPSGPAKTPDSPEWRQHESAVSHLTRYQTRGAFAYISGRQRVYARFNWTQTDADSYRLLLTNPLGGTELDLSVRPNTAKIINNQGKTYTSEDAQTMLQKLTGMDIPLDNLRQWLVGLPGDAHDFALDDRGLLKQVNYYHNGRRWKVSYLNYRDDTLPPMPGNIELREDDQLIKLRMDTWSLK